MSFREYAEREFKVLGYTPLNEDQEDGPNKWVQENVLELLEVFSSQGHSGSSAPYVINIFKKLASWEPLSPLTGADDEWDNCIDSNLAQNKRCGHVFKDKTTGEAYDSTAKIFRRPDGLCYTNRDSRVPVTFPYTPALEYIEVED